MKKKKKWSGLLLFLAVQGLLVVPLYAFPDNSVLISSSLAIIFGFLIVFYQVALVFLEKDDPSKIESGLLGLPGEDQPNNGIKKVKKQKKVVIDKSLPGVSKPSDSSEPVFEIDEGVVKHARLIPEISEVDLMRGIVESIGFWDDLSFYKIKDGVVYKSETVKMIGELYDFVFAGLGTYLQRYKLSLDELLSEQTIVKEYGESYSSVVIGFIISLIEKEVATSLHIPIDKPEIVIPKIKSQNTNLIKVISAPEFKHQILLLIGKSIERQKQEQNH